jgi:hypothetical protein
VQGRDTDPTTSLGGDSRQPGFNAPEGRVVARKSRIGCGREQQGARRPRTLASSGKDHAACPDVPQDPAPAEQSNNTGTTIVCNLYINPPPLKMTTNRELGKQYSSPRLTSLRLRG